MQKIIIIISVFLLIGCSKQPADNLDQLINSMEDIIIEENAKIHIGLFDDDFAKKIIAHLEEFYPGVYSYEIIDESLLLDMDDFDIVQTLIEHTPLMSNQLGVIDDNLLPLLESEYIEKYTKDVNQSQNYFMPFDSKGLLFAYNKTMLEALGVDMTLSGDSYLPESINSFEKISFLAAEIQAEKLSYRDELVESIFSFPFNEQLAMLSFIENSDFKLVTGTKGEDMNLGQDLFEALEQYASLGATDWLFGSLSNEDMLWNYEKVLEEQSAPFLLVGNWMFYEDYQQSQAYELVFTELPSFNDSQLSTLSSVSGFVLNKESKFPMAQNIFLKSVKTKEGIVATIDAGIIPIIDPIYLDDLDQTINNNIEEMIIAYQDSNYMSLQAFAKDPSILAAQIFYDIDFRDIWRDLFLAKIEPIQAYDAMLILIDEWILENNLELEVEKYELERDISEGS